MHTSGLKLLGTTPDKVLNLFGFDGIPSPCIFPAWFLGLLGGELVEVGMLLGLDLVRAVLALEAGEETRHSSGIGGVVQRLRRGIE